MSHAPIPMPVESSKLTSRIDLVIGATLFFLTVVVVGATEDDIGFTRDEGYYFKAAEQYFGWFRDLFAHLSRGEIFGAFSQSVIDKHWSYNHEHPVLVKTLFALSWGVLKEGFGIFDLSSSAFRFPAWVFAGLSVWLTYVLARALSLSVMASTLAALLWITMPRVFWHTHLACFDIPVCAAHLWLVVGYIKYRHTRRGALFVGVLFGLAIAVKHNVLVTPAFFVLHWMLVEARGIRSAPSGLVFPPIPLVFFSIAVVGPIVFVMHWPYLWPDVIMRIGWYLGFHLTHEHYPILYFGDLLTKPPFPVSFPFVMSAITIPLPTLAMLVCGLVLGALAAARVLIQRFWNPQIDAELTTVPLGDVGRAPSGSAALLLLLNIAFPFLLIALPSSPIFGGTKHWMNALPFMCVLAAWAFDECLTRLKTEGGSFVRARATWVMATLAILVVMSATVLTARTHPFGLGSYNSVVGFTRGAANHGFQRTFWGYEPRGALDEINGRTRSGGRIHFGDTNRDDFNMYKRDALLRKDILITGAVRGADVVSVQPQGEFKEQWIDVLNEWDVVGPDRVLHSEGVPMATVTFKPGP